MTSLQLVLGKLLGLENMKSFLCQTGKELFLQNHCSLSHCFPVIAEHISERSNDHHHRDRLQSLSLPTQGEHFLRLYYFFRAVLGSEQNWCEGTKVSHMPPAPTHAWPPPSSTSTTRVVHLLKLMNLHGHIITTQSL